MGGAQLEANIWAMAFAVAACFVASPALSAVPAERQAMQVLRDYADCVVATDFTAAKKFLRTFPYSDREREEADTILQIKNSCTDPVTIRLTLFHLRGAISEALYKKRFTFARTRHRSFCGRCRTGLAFPKTTRFASQVGCLRCVERYNRHALDDSGTTSIAS